MQFPGFNTLLVGPTGTGKTYCLRTLLDAEIEPFILFTEPGMEVLGDIDDKVHWAYIPPATTDWDTLIDGAKKINTLSHDALQKMAGVNKSKYSQFIEVLSCLHNFVDQRGESFGDISDWGPNRAIILDSLSGLSVMAMDLVVGSKPVKTLPDWGVAMDNLERLLQKLCMDTKCHFIMTAHLEPERDEVSGAVRNYPSTLGKKLAPKIPRFFSDVVLTKQEGGQFFWATVSSNTDLKARNLPLADKLDPTFTQLVEGWVKQGGHVPPPVIVGGPGSEQTPVA